MGMLYLESEEIEHDLGGLALRTELLLENSFPSRNLDFFFKFLVRNQTYLNELFHALISPLIAPFNSTAFLQCK